MIDEQQRRAYLGAMQVTQWLPRTALPFAAPPVGGLLPSTPWFKPTNQANQAMRHVISLLLENEAGALSRVSGLFSARGYNIESLTVAAFLDRYDSISSTNPCKAGGNISQTPVDRHIDTNWL